MSFSFSFSSNSPFTFSTSFTPPTPTPALHHSAPHLNLPTPSSFHSPVHTVPTSAFHIPHPHTTSSFAPLHLPTPSPSPVYTFPPSAPHPPLPPMTPLTLASYHQAIHAEIVALQQQSLYPHPSPNAPLSTSSYPLMGAYPHPPFTSLSSIPYPPYVYPLPLMASTSPPSQPPHPRLSPSPLPTFALPYPTSTPSSFPPPRIHARASLRRRPHSPPPHSYPPDRRPPSPVFGAAFPHFPSPRGGSPPPFPRRSLSPPPPPVPGHMFSRLHSLSSHAHVQVQGQVGVSGGAGGIGGFGFSPQAMEEHPRAASAVALSGLKREAMEGRKSSPSPSVDGKGVDEGDVKTCSICICDFGHGDVAVLMPCSHPYHEVCIFPWLRKQNTCPSCRFELMTDDEVYNRMILQKQERQRQEQERRLQRLKRGIEGEVVQEVSPPPRVSTPALPAVLHRGEQDVVEVRSDDSEIEEVDIDEEEDDEDEEEDEEDAETMGDDSDDDEDDEDEDDDDVDFDEDDISDEEGEDSDVMEISPPHAPQSNRANPIVLDGSDEEA